MQQTVETVVINHVYYNLNLRGVTKKPDYCHKNFNRTDFYNL